VSAFKEYSIIFLPHSNSFLIILPFLSANVNAILKFP